MKRLFSLFLLAAMAMSLALPARAAETVDTAMAPSGMALVGDTLYVADSYNRAVWTVEDGEASLLTGVGDNRLAPRNTATRAQVAAILTRFFSCGWE